MWNSWPTVQYGDFLSRPLQSWRIFLLCTARSALELLVYEWVPFWFILCKHIKIHMRLGLHCSTEQWRLGVLAEICCFVPPKAEKKKLLAAKRGCKLQDLKETYYDFCFFLQRFIKALVLVKDIQS